MKKNIGQLAGEVYALLEGQEKDENIKILASVSTLLGINIPENKGNQSGAGLNNPGSQNNFGASSDAKSYFNLKAPAVRSVLLALGLLA